MGENGNCLAMVPEEKGILCVGPLSLCMVKYMSRYPAENTVINSDEFSWEVGGSAMHSVMVLRQLGAMCSFLGSVSSDSSYPFFMNKLAPLDISIQHCPLRSDQPMDIAVVLKSAATNTATRLHSEKLTPLTAEEFSRFCLNDINLEEVGWIHFDGRHPEEIGKMLDFIKEVRKTRGLTDLQLSLNVDKPVPGIEMILNKPDVIFVGKGYAKAKGHNNMGTAARSLVRAAWAGAKVVVSWLEKGATGTIAGGGPKDFWAVLPHPPKAWVDPQGAEAAFNAGVILAFSRGADLERAMMFGCKVAGIKCGQKGFIFEKEAETELKFENLKIS